MAGKPSNNIWAGKPFQLWLGSHQTTFGLGSPFNFGWEAIKQHLGWEALSTLAGKPSNNIWAGKPFQLWLGSHQTRVGQHLDFSGLTPDSSMHFWVSNLIHQWMYFRISNLIHRRTLGFQSPFIDALLGFIPHSSMHFWGFKTHSSMHFWVSNHIHRCTFGFQSPFIDALLSFIPYSSMHFGFHTHSSMHFWVSHPIHRCTFVFHTSFIDVLWGFKPHSSMHFWSSHRVHQCTLAFWRPETATIDALGLFGGSDWQSSMDSRGSASIDEWRLSICFYHLWQASRGCSYHHTRRLWSACARHMWDKKCIDETCACQFFHQCTVGPRVH